MGQHHRVQQADAPSQPRGCHVRDGIETSCREEQNREILFGEAIPLKEPARDQRGAEKTSAQAVDAEQERQSGDGVAAPAILDWRRVPVRVEITSTLFDNAA